MIVCNGHLTFQKYFHAHSQDFRSTFGCGVVSFFGRGALHRHAIFYVNVTGNIARRCSNLIEQPKFYNIDRLYTQDGD